MNKLPIDPLEQDDENCLFTLPNLRVFKQCDQIWRNFTTLTKFYKSLEKYWRFISYLAKHYTDFVKFVTVLGKFSLSQTAQYWNIIYPSGHTNSQIRMFVKSSRPQFSLEVFLAQICLPDKRTSGRDSFMLSSKLCNRLSQREENTRFWRHAL